MKTEGLMKLYRGALAGAFRQFFFAALRIGLYFNYADYMKSTKHKSSLSLLESTAGSLVAGAIGISTVMPVDVIYVRFQVENALPLSQRRGYTGLTNAFTRIINEEGFKALWRGMIPAIARAMALNLGLLVPYEMCKKIFAKYFGYSRKNYLLSSAVAGLGAAFCCLPFDNAKVKIQKMKPGADGKMPYKGLIDCLAKTVKREGVRGLWAGFFATYMVAAPHAMLMLIISDGLRILLGISKT